ncbi:hypothetical protein D3C83_317030 [compost metagenome]
MAQDFKLLAELRQPFDGSVANLRIDDPGVLNLSGVAGELVQALLVDEVELDGRENR